MSQITKEQAAEIQRNLAQFGGSTRFYRHFLACKLIYTEGVQYMAETCEAYWLIDLIASWQEEIKQRYPRQAAFQVWKLYMTGKTTAVALCEDGNGHELARQKIHYTDFPLEGGITLWVQKNEAAGLTIMLPSEY